MFFLRALWSLFFVSLLWGQFIPFAVWEKKESRLLLSYPSVLSFVSRNCSPVVTLQTTWNSITPQVLTAPLTVNLSSTPGLTYFSDINCTSPITDLVVASGTSQSTFYFIYTGTGALNVDASAINWKSDDVDLTIAANPFVWTGGAAPITTWSTGANWSGGIAPGSTDLAVFDDSCIGNCDPSFTGAVTIGGLRLESTYTGSIVQGAYDFITNQLVQRAGAIIGDVTGSYYFAVNGGGALILSAGTFTYPVGNMYISGEYVVSPAFSLIIPANSTFTFRCLFNGWSCFNSPKYFTIANQTYQNVNIQGRNTHIGLNGSTFSIAGDLQFGDTYNASYAINSGTIFISGDITQTGYGNRGTAIFVVDGNPSGQVVTGSAVTGQTFPHLRIDAETNAVTLVGTIITPDYEMLSAGSFTTTGTTLNIRCTSSTLGCRSSMPNVAMGNVTYNNVSFEPRRANIDFGGASFTVLGNLSIGAIEDTSIVLRNGSISFYGETLSEIHNGMRGPAIIELLGNPAGQTIVGNGRRLPALKINTGVNNVTMTGNVLVPGFEYVSAGTFTAPPSLSIRCFISGSHCETTEPLTMIMGGQVYNDLNLHTRRQHMDLGGQTIIVNGSFTYGDYETANISVTNGTFMVGGDVTVTDYGLKGNAVIELTGNPFGQTITGIGVRSLNMRVNTGVHPVTMNGQLTMYDYQYLTSGTLNANNAHVDLDCESGQPCFDGNLSPSFGPYSYGLITFDLDNTVVDLQGATLNVTQDLAIGDQRSTNGQLNNGSILIGGSLSVFSNGVGGSASITMNGSTNASISGNAQSLPDGTFTIAKTGGATVSVLANVSLDGTGQDLNITGGTLDMSGFALNVNDVLTIGAGTTLTQNAGALTYGSLINNGTLNP